MAPNRKENGSGRDKGNGQPSNDIRFVNKATTKRYANFTKKT